LTTQSVIENKLMSAFSPLHLDVQNESFMHSVPPGSETHFKVTLVADTFAGLRAVKRHQLVYQVLADELANGVHALAIHTYTPDEWQGASPASPKCLGGSKEK
jgi:BolA family transcriptional regulator, general stress-responsive regulator